MFNHGKCVCMRRGAQWKLATLSPDNATECVVCMAGCDVLNKKGFTRHYVLSEHTIVYIIYLLL